MLRWCWLSCCVLTNCFPALTLTVCGHYHGTNCTVDVYHWMLYGHQSTCNESERRINKLQKNYTTRSKSNKPNELTSQTNAADGHQRMSDSIHKLSISFASHLLINQFINVSLSHNIKNLIFRRVLLIQINIQKLIWRNKSRISV